MTRRRVIIVLVAAISLAAAASAVGLSLGASAASAQPLVRGATATERRAIDGVVKWTWSYESSTRPYPAGVGMHVKPLRAHPRVVSIRVVRSGRASYATAAVELIHDGRQLPGTAVLLLGRFHGNQYEGGGPWASVTEPARSFPLSCTTATPSRIRALLCPSPWKVLGVAPPRRMPPQSFGLHLRSGNLRAVNWRNITLPGAVCGAQRTIQLRHGAGFVYSVGHPWWPAVVVSDGPATYGDLTGDGRDEAAVVVSCSNGGGTADGQLAFAAAIFAAVGHSLRLIGVLSPRQPFEATTPHVPLVASVRLLPGRAIVHEGWYGPPDGTCCGSGKATTVWRYVHGELTPSHTTVTRPPRQ